MREQRKKVEIKAAAKINLMLDIVHRRTDGYHDLFMVMQSIDLYDTVQVAQTEQTGISLYCSDPTLPTDSKNIAYKAALAFFDYQKEENPSVSIKIEKRIPAAAGLAGGSADGAAVLVGLNELLQTHFSIDTLCNIGVKVGADVPFCIRGGTLLAQGIGDVLHTLRPMPNCFLLLVKPTQGVNTAQAYAQYDAQGRQYEPNKMEMLSAVQGQDLTGICANLANVFEQFIEVPQRVELRQMMGNFGAKGVCMSGSGPTVFGIFDDKETVLACQSALATVPGDVFLCHPVKQGCQFKSKK